jgi:hypothetical protein
MPLEQNITSQGVIPLYRSRRSGKGWEGRRGRAVVKAGREKDGVGRWAEWCRRVVIIFLLAMLVDPRPYTYEYRKPRLSNPT